MEAVAGASRSGGEGGCVNPESARTIAAMERDRVNRLVVAAGKPTRRPVPALCLTKTEAAEALAMSVDSFERYVTRTFV
jgi:hypothetical protein